jgi:hypothetical protein
MFTHEDGRMGVVQEIPGKVGNFRNNLPGNLDMSWRRD